jgi:hypothetical protein
MEKNGCYVIVPDHQVPLLVHHYHQLASRVIGIPALQERRDWNYPSPERFFVRATDNIITMYMLPVASAVADNIYILGADGVSPDGYAAEWAHGRFWYPDKLVKSALETHPSAQRGMNLAAMYSSHCRTVEDVIEFGESKGKKYYTLAKSYIPALGKRLWQARSD